MFLVNVGYRWTYKTLGADGIIILPSKIPSARVMRETLDAKILLLDPQLYLAHLDKSDCGKTCWYLGSYPWFLLPGTAPHATSGLGQRDWEAQVQSAVAESWNGRAPEGASIEKASRLAIDTQLEIGCTQIILPCPLITQRENEGEIFGTWLDAGLKYAGELDLEIGVLMSVPLSEEVLSEEAFGDLGFLDTIVDVVTSRDGLSGVYILIARTTSNHPFERNRLTLRAYLRLSKAFGEAGYELVLVNFADVFGLVCLGTGANGLATGDSQSLRTLSLEGLKDQTGGRALPYFYSHPAVAEFSTENDLNLLRDHNLVRRLCESTPETQQLIATLLARGSASTLAAWAESQGNTRAAHTHFLQRLMDETSKLKLKTLGERRLAIREWLESATANRLLLKQRLGDALYRALKGEVAKTDVWLEEFDIV